MFCSCIGFLVACGVTRIGPCPVRFVVLQLILKVFLELFIVDLKLCDGGWALACSMPCPVGYY